MNKRFKNYIYIFIISPEIISILLTFIIFWIWPNIFEKSAMIFFIADNSKFTLLLIAPGFCITSGLALLKKVILPEIKIKELVNWENYKLLKDGAYLSFFWILLALFVTIILWINKENYTLSSITSFYLAFNLSALVSTASLYIASNKVVEILVKHG